MKENVDAMCAELRIDLREIVVSGGGSNSPLFMNIFSDVFGVPASRNVGSSGAALGAAICAAVATGVYPDFPTATGAMKQSRQAFAPNLENHEVYRRMNERVYRVIHDATDPILEQSFSIFH